MPEKPRRKVNPPARVKKKLAQERRHAERTGGSGQQPMRGAGGVFLVTALAVVMIGGLAIFGWQEFSKRNPEDVQPWLSVEKRMVVSNPGTESEASVYRYKPKEVAHWKKGAADTTLPAADLDVLLTRAVELLTVPDATDVVLVAAAARPDQVATVIAPHAAKLASQANAADPVERECRMKLAAIGKGG